MAHEDKEKWPVKELVAKRQWRLLRGWLRYVESLSDDEEEVVHVCEPEAGRNLSDDELRSLDDLKYCQEGRDEISNCQVGNKKRSLVDDLIDCQEGSREVPRFPGGYNKGSETI
jgi:hypothetical protein